MVELTARLKKHQQLELQLGFWAQPLNLQQGSQAQPVGLQLGL